MDAKLLEIYKNKYINTVVSLLEHKITEEEWNELNRKISEELDKRLSNDH